MAAKINPDTLRILFSFKHRSNHRFEPMAWHGAMRRQNSRRHRFKKARAPHPSKSMAEYYAVRRGFTLRRRVAAFEIFRVAAECLEVAARGLIVDCRCSTQNGNSALLNADVRGLTQSPCRR
jgi:hypothetical protein